MAAGRISSAGYDMKLTRVDLRVDWQVIELLIGRAGNCNCNKYEIFLANNFGASYVASDLMATKPGAVELFMTAALTWFIETLNGLI